MITLRMMMVALGSTLAAAAILLQTSSAISSTVNVQQKIVLPPTPFKFQRIFDSADVSVEVDRSTISALIDGDKDVIVGAVIRVVRKMATSGETASFISATLAVCGHNGIILSRSRDFGIDGRHVGDVVKPVPMPNLSVGQPGEAIYRLLCGSGIKPTPIDPSYKAPSGYTKFWS